MVVKNRWRNAREKSHLSQKFVADLWQTSRQALADMFGFTVREVDSALDTLKRLRVVFTELRPLISHGVRLSNVLYVGLNLPILVDISTPITFERNTSNIETLEVSHSVAIPDTPKRNTYTKTSPKTSQRIITSYTDRNSSPSAPTSTSKPTPTIQKIPEAIMKLIPKAKRSERHLSIVAAALEKKGGEIVTTNISMALAKATKPDPWGMVMDMLRDLIGGSDWYADERERDTATAKMQATTAHRRQREAEATERQRQDELQRQAQLVQLMESLPIADREEIEASAATECERIGVPLSGDILHATAINILAERYHLAA